MSSQNQGRQSPTPTDQSDSQTGRTSGGQGVNDKSDNKEISKQQLEGLESNPKPILEDHLKEATKKTESQKKD